MDFVKPDVDYAVLSPILALTAGTVVVMFTGLLKGRALRTISPLLTLLSLGVSAGLLIWQTGANTDLVEGTLRMDDLAVTISLMAVLAAAVATILSIREPAADQGGRGDYNSLLLCSTLGMTLLAASNDLLTLFIALELLSIPLYVLCGSALRRAESLESGLKYLVIGSLGSATVLYGLAFIYGASGETGFPEIAKSIAAGDASDPLLLIGVALAATGLAFKVSLAPFHQWTPDVYEGAPTPITAFMAVATKAAAFAVFLRLFEVALGPVAGDWQDALAVLAALSIAVGNIGALGQDSVKRILAYSGIAQAGYILIGVVVATEQGVNALVFYLAVYTLMNLAAFAVIVARERETGIGDHIDALRGIGQSRPALAWPMTIAMLGLAGLPGTAGFVGKLFLIRASVDGDYTWLAVAIAIGTTISLAYYLRIIAAMWMPAEAGEPASASPRLQPAIAGGSPDLQPPASSATPPEAAGRHWDEVTVVAILAAAAVLFFGVISQPLAEWSEMAGDALSRLP